MPRLDDAALDHLAALARLDLHEADRDALRRDLQRVLDYVDRLAAHDDPTARPLRHPAHDGRPVAPAALRADRPVATPSALDPTVERRDGHVVVPRTVDADA